MAESLVGEVAGWLGSPVAHDLTDKERLVLFVIAERCHRKTRRMLWHRGDKWPDGIPMTLSDTICLRAGMGARTLTDVCQRLAGRGVEVRVEVGRDSIGRPVFAHRGRSVDFWLPPLPASVRLPERG
ncbi:hypothetical protein [Nonomuraea sp. LPB2021202275-12-8]|uniref:hypothetical protein n=1 Tax=Nonomuraea sp. LPB2021202275-12-8 TaxID=3120159 RepID=UPI00300C8B9F